jgi:hypothetical protein
MSELRATDMLIVPLCVPSTSSSSIHVMDMRLGTFQSDVVKVTLETGSSWLSTEKMTCGVCMCVCVYVCM